MLTELVAYVYVTAIAHGVKYIDWEDRMKFEDVKILNGDEEIDAELTIYAEPRNISVGEIVCVASKDLLRSTHVHFRFNSNDVPMRGYAVMRDSNLASEPSHLKHYGQIRFDILWINGPQESSWMD